VLSSFRVSTTAKTLHSDLKLQILRYHGNVILSTLRR
jgi:hypothetical protein